jgi:hypothetical protein
MGRRRYRKRADLDSPWWWAAALFRVMLLVILVAVTILWALIALPIAGVAKLAHNDELARKMIRSIGFWLGAGH